MSANTKIGSKPRVIVLGIDGVPFSFLQKRFKQGGMKSFAALADRGDMKRMRTVVPPISSVAWTSFMTGKNPAKHGVFGFVERNPETMEMKIPTRRELRTETLTEVLSRYGKYVVQMNVPCSYPPTSVNGKLVSGFLATSLDKATYPKDFYKELESMGYVIDVDSWKARTDRDGFLDDIFHALEMRLKATLHLIDKEPWDFFISHIMETDRIAHFFWEFMENNDPVYGERVLDFFEKVDKFIDSVQKAIRPEDNLIILSDHGFCTLEKEVYVNNALIEAGFLKLNTDQPKSPKDIHPSSIAYSMIPGRFYVNLKGRESTGCVEPGNEYEEVRKKLRELLMNLKDPETGGNIIKKVFMKEEVYKGDYFDEAADVVVLPFDGYDLKGNLKGPALTDKGYINGMHTDWDATLFVRNSKIIVDDPVITDLMPSILNIYQIKGEDIDGRIIF
ncbi:MAG TPA: alkaline phosphatase family protein [bacterium]|nr:alkaline phosphatase family protein [bacterium]